MVPKLLGWNGRILRVDLNTKKTTVEEYSPEMASKYIGGRGFATRLLWDELPPGTDPFSPDNILVTAAGPLTALPVPNTGKIVVASKSPLTGGYGDGNLGSRSAVNLRKAGYDAVIITGKADKPSYLSVENNKTEILDAKEIWGLDSFKAEKHLLEKHGVAAGVLGIGPAGENLVRFATIVSQEGRAGGRTGMGAVMGSKNLKAMVFVGTGDIKVADEEGLRRLGAEAYQDILHKANYAFWKRQGTMATIEWSQENSTLPTFNFREGMFDNASAISGTTMEKMTIENRGCPNCNMTCGNIIEDSEKREAELDYENVAMLGADIGLGDLRKVATLNRMADELGIDTITLGSSIGFAMECSEKHLINLELPWGDFDGAKMLTEDIAHKRGVGRILSDGVKRASEKIGHGSEKWAMQIKGLECSAYDCHLCPGMALSFATSPIGAHHKDAWVISWEVSSGTRREYNEAKVDKVLEFQRIRGGMFEGLVACRLPWIELGFDLEWYPRFLQAATGLKTSLSELFSIGDRFYSLIRAFWVREYGGKWSSEMDFPPPRWFEEPTTKGPLMGSVLDMEKYQSLLQMYYTKRGWDSRGIPRKSTMSKLGLAKEAAELEKYVRLVE